MVLTQTRGAQFVLQDLVTDLLVNMTKLLSIPRAQGGLYLHAPLPGADHHSLLPQDSEGIGQGPPDPPVLRGDPGLPEKDLSVPVLVLVWHPMGLLSPACREGPRRGHQTGMGSSLQVETSLRSRMETCPP